MSVDTRAWRRAACCLWILAGVATLGTAEPQAEMTSETPATPPAPSAVVADLSGKVWIRRQDPTVSVLATLGQRLRVGDQLHTDDGASASIFLAGGQIIEERIRKKTKMQ